MLREEGLVVTVEGDHATVSSQRQSACGSCHAEGSCGVLSGGLGKGDVRVRARNLVGAGVGEQVVMEISESRFLRASFLAYGFPVLSLVAVGAAVRSLALSMGAGEGAEGIGALAGLAALGLSFYWLQYYNTKLAREENNWPVITHIVAPAAQEMAAPVPQGCTLTPTGAQQ